jgi:hypothetical protein
MLTTVLPAVTAFDVSSLTTSEQSSITSDATELAGRTSRRHCKQNSRARRVVVAWHGKAAALDRYMRRSRPAR